MKQRLLTEVDGTTFNGVEFNVRYDQDQFSEELRYASSAFDNKLDYTVGAYYFEQEYTLNEANIIFGPANRGGTVDQFEYAFFAQGEYQLSDSLSITLGARYSYVEKDGDIFLQNVGCTGPFICTPTVRNSEDWSNLGGKAYLQWQPSENLLVYGGWSRAFRSGGFDVRASTLTATEAFNHETVDAYELGFKADFWGGRARLNGAVFRNESEDLQRTVLGGINGRDQATLNAASATQQGVELELTLSPADNFVLTAALGLLDSEYNEFGGLDLTGDGIPDPDLAKDLDLLRAPKLTYSVSGNYDVPLAENGSLSFRLAYNFRDDIPINVANSSRLGSYGLLGASASWTSSSEKYKISVFGKNLTDEFYGSNGFNVAGGGIVGWYLDPPRTWGIQFEYDYE